MKKLSLAWWDRFSQPAPIANPSPAQKERYRQAHLISRFLLLIFVITMLGTPSIFAQADGVVMLMAAVSYIFYILTLFLNRSNRTLLAGTCSLIGLIVGILTPLLFQRAALDVGSLAIYYLFVVVEIVAGALMPPLTVFLVALIDCALICLSFFLQPKTQAVQAMVKASLAMVLLPPILMQMLVAAVMYIVVFHLLQAIHRADRAEEIARLQREISAYEHAKLQNRQQLDDALVEIAAVHAQVAAGNLDARVALDESEVLWTIAVPLNNLLSRTQQWKHAAEQLARKQGGTYNPSPTSSFPTQQSSYQSPPGRMHPTPHA